MCRRPSTGGQITSCLDTYLPRSYDGERFTDARNTKKVGGLTRMAKSTKRSVGRRGFLKGAAVGAAALAAKPELAKAQQPAGRGGRGAQTPSGATVARETGAARPAANARVIEHPGSDFMVDVLKTLNLEYLGSNPGSTVRIAARVAHQLRRQQNAGVPHLHA